MWTFNTNTTPFTGPKADAYFDRQETKLAFFGSPMDSTLHATARALIYPHLEGNNYQVFYNPIRQIIAPEDLGSNTLYILPFTNDEIEGKEKKLMELYTPENGWTFLNKVKTFFGNYPVFCFIKPDRRTSAVYMPRLTAQKLHGILRALPAFVPWFFPEKPSPIEMELLNSLTESSPDKYLSVLEKMAEPYEFEAGYLRNMLSGFAARSYEQELNRVRSRCADILRGINDYQNEISRLLKEKRDVDVRALGLEAAIENAKDDNELLDYFTDNPYISFEGVDEDTLTFVVNDHLMYYDEDFAEECIGRKASFLYNAGDVRIPYCPEVKEFYKRLFIDKSIKLRMAAVYMVTPGQRVDTMRGYQNYDDTYLPNTHINEHRCIGDYINAINGFLQRGDTIGAIEQCMASARSINLHESATNYRFIQSLYNTTRRCIEWSDGSLCTPKQAIKKIQDELAGGENNNE